MPLEEDVRAKLEAEVWKSGKSFKETVNDTLRLGLCAREKAIASEPFEIRAWDMGLKPGYNLDKPRDLIEEIEGPDYR